jgi:EpsI family protein
VEELVLRGPGGELVVWYWYDVHDRLTTRRLPAKLAEARARLIGAESGAALVAIATPRAARGDAAARALLARLAGQPAVRLAHMYVGTATP